MGYFAVFSDTGGLPCPYGLAIPILTVKVHLIEIDSAWSYKATRMIKRLALPFILNYDVLGYFFFSLIIWDSNFLFYLFVLFEFGSSYSDSITTVFFF